MNTREMKNTFTKQEVIAIIDDMLQRPDMVIDAVTNENTDHNARDFFNTCAESGIRSLENDIARGYAKRDPVSIPTQGTVKSAEEILRKHLPADCIWEDEGYPSDFNLCNTPNRYVIAAMKEYASQLPPNNEAMAPQSSGVASYRVLSHGVWHVVDKKQYDDYIKKKYSGQITISHNF